MNKFGVRDARVQFGAKVSICCQKKDIQVVSQSESFYPLFPFVPGRFALLIFSLINNINVYMSIWCEIDVMVD